MTPERAALSFLNQWNGSTRDHATILQREGRVSQIFGNRQITRGRVEIDDSAYHCTLRFVNEAWQGECEPRDGQSPAALVAVMLERIERGADLPESPVEIGSDDIHTVLERRLGRQLDEEEEEFLAKLVKRYQRYTATREIHATDLVRLQPRWPIDSYEPLNLWPKPPSDLVEFWNYLAYNFNKKGLRWPGFLDAITNLEEVARKLQRWERDKLQGVWRKRLQVFTGREARVDSASVQLRLVVTFSEMRLQWRRLGSDAMDRSADGDWETLDNDDFGSFHERLEHGQSTFDPESAALWYRFMDHWRRQGQVRLRLEDRQHGQWLADLWQDGALADRLVSLDEVPLRHEEAPLHWQCCAAADGESYRLRLLQGEDGEPLPHSVRALPGLHKTFYLADESVFEGPQWWGDDTEVLPEYEVPRSLIESDQGLEFLQRIKARIDDELESRVEGIAVRLRLEANVTNPGSPGAREHLVLRVTGRDASGEHVEELGPDGWTVTRQLPSGKGRLRRFDREHLRQAQALLEPLQMNYDQGLRAFRSRVTRNFPEKFHRWLEALPEDVPLELDDTLESLRADPLKARLDVSLSGQPGDDWFDLKLALDVDLEGHELSRQELKELIAARGGFVRASDGRWHRVRLDLTESQAASVEQLGIDAYDPGDSSQRLHAAQLADAATSDLLTGRQRDLALEAAGRIALEVRPPVPTGLQVHLRPYQIHGFQFLAYLSENRFGGILADDMGLGKTLQTITWLLWMKRQAEDEPGEEGGPSLVVCPKSVVDVWLAEVSKATPDLTIRNLKESTAKAPDLKGVDILCINYAQLRGCAEWLQKIHWKAVVLDEGQHIKNPDSLAARTARSLEARHRLVLSGTPIENRLLDIWSLMEFAMPQVLGTRSAFRKRFDRRRDPQAHVRLSARLRPFLLRRAKRQVAPELPARSEEVLLTDLTEPQREMYDRELDRIRTVLLQSADDKVLNENRFVILQGLTKLRQICCHPGLLEETMLETGEVSAKLEALLELIDQLRAEGHKVLVFSQFVRMLNVVADVLKKRRVPFSMLTGKTSDRGSLVEEFQQSEDARVFLLSLKAGGSGLNLTAASYVVLFDPWWNPAVENQAIDRTHRIGQQNPVTAYRLIARDTVEAKIRAMQEYKSALAGDILSDDAFGRSLTRDDLRFLLDLDSSGEARDENEGEAAPELEEGLATG